jgi:hypothetical protein
MCVNRVAWLPVDLGGLNAVEAVAVAADQLEPKGIAFSVSGV